MEQRGRYGRLRQLSLRRAERGVSLIELMVVASILLTIGGSVVVFAPLGSKPGSIAADRVTITSALGQAVETAQSTNNGATLLFDRPNATGPIEAEIFDGRPNGNANAPMPATPSHRMPLETAITASGQNVTTIPFAIFLDAFGHATMGDWSPASGTITIPTCTVTGAALTITIPSGAAPTTMSLSCGQDEFEIYDSLGNLIPQATQ
jgi:hypothetical protein